MKRVVKRALLIGALCAAFGMTAMMCQRVSDRGRYAGAYSTYSAGPTGTRGLYLLAEASGANPQRWAEELGRLPPRGMLVALGSCETWLRRPIGRVERETLTRWVESGGILVVAGVPDYVLKSELGVELVGDPERCRPTEGLIGMLARSEERSLRRKRETRDDEPDFEDLSESFARDPEGAIEELTATDALPQARRAIGVADPVSELPAVGMRAPLTIEIDEARPRRTLMRLDGPDGPLAAVRVDVGDEGGAVVALASASQFQNRDLSSEVGGVLFARLLTALAPRGPVLFDEFHLGVGTRRSTMRYLRQAGMTPLLIQVAILVALALWFFGARFGGIGTAPPAEPAGTASYVSSIARLYEKARDPEGTLEILIRRALTRIAEHHRVHHRSGPGIAAFLESRGRGAQAQAVNEIMRLERVEVSGRTLPRTVQLLDELTERAIGEAALRA